MTVGEEEEFEVSQVLDSGSVRGKLHYLVRWKGYGAEDDLWVPEQELEGTDALARWKDRSGT